MAEYSYIDSGEFYGDDSSHQTVPTSQDIYKYKEGSHVNRKAVIKSELDRLQAELTILNRYPDEDPCQDGDVLRFEVVWGCGSDPTHYDYAAVKAAGKYYVTGRAPIATGRSWRHLVEWMAPLVTGEVWVWPADGSEPRILIPKVQAS